MIKFHTQWLKPTLTRCGSVKPEWDADFTKDASLPHRRPVIFKHCMMCEGWIHKLDCQWLDDGTNGGPGTQYKFFYPYLRPPASCYPTVSVKLGQP